MPGFVRKAASVVLAVAGGSFLNTGLVGDDPRDIFSGLVGIALILTALFLALPIPRRRPEIPPKPDLIALSTSAPPGLPMEAEYERRMDEWRQKLHALGVTEKEALLILAEKEHERRVAEINEAFPG